MNRLVGAAIAASIAFASTARAEDTQPQARVFFTIQAGAWTVTAFGDDGGTKSCTVRRMLPNPAAGDPESIEFLFTKRHSTFKVSSSAWKLEAASRIPAVVHAGERVR